MSGENGSNGSGGLPVPPDRGPAGEHPEEEDFAIGEVPREVFELAERCRAYVLTALGVELDYEPETLPLLDEYLRTASSGIADRPELEPLVTRAAAAYLGEVVRRRVDGFWRAREDPHEPWVVSSRRAFMTVSPLGAVRNALGPDEEGASTAREIELTPPDEALAEARLAALPPVSDEEYRLLSTRVEVIDIVYEALREQMRAEDRASLVFDESDYEDE